MGTGEAEGDNRAIEAASKAIANPLLDGVSMKGAKGVIVSITGGEDMRLLEVDEAANHIRELVDEDANIIWGSAFNPDLEGKIRVSVVATGIEADGSVVVPAAEPATRAFSFGRKPVETPAAPTPVEEPAPAAEAETTPSFEVEAPAAEPVAEAHDAVEDDADELVLGSDAQLSAPKVYGDEEFPAAADENASNDTGTPGWLSPGDEGKDDAAIAAGSEEDTPKPRMKLGGTLFERMQSVARSGSRDEEEGGKEPLDIPRFLHRQNNQ
jgi:cell division protein FtsZ